MTVPQLSFSPQDIASIPKPEDGQIYTDWLEGLYKGAEGIIQGALNDEKLWAQGKKYDGNISIKTCKNHPATDTFWVFRHITFDAATSATAEIPKNYDYFKRGMYRNPAILKEKSFFKDGLLVEERAEGTIQIIRINYKMPLLVTDRYFDILVIGREVINPETNKRSLYIITTPITFDSITNSDDEINKDLRDTLNSMSKSHVAAKNIRVEFISELDDDKVLWGLACSSQLGGSMSDTLTNSALPGVLSSIVPSVYNYLDRIATA